MITNTKVGDTMLVRDTKRRTEKERCRQNINIDNSLAVKRVYQVEPIDTSSWAYMRAMREIGTTKKQYAVDPYVEVYEMQPGVFGLLEESIDGMGDVWLYLIVGEEKAMLIDTGFGLGDLKGLCAELSGGKELLVVNTHGHPDHAYGNAQFESVFCHEYELGMLNQQNKHMWDYLFEDGVRGAQTIWAEFDERDIIPYRDYEIVPCISGFSFELGCGHEVELVHLGGHSAGSCGFLDKRNRCFFAGDDIINMRVGVFGGRPGETHADKCTVSTMRDNFETLSKRLDEFDYVYSGHFVTKLENTAVTAMLEACRAICADPAGNSSFSRDGQYFRYVEGLGTIAYSEKSV